MIFFTADTHFQHRAIIPACGRPFATVEAMDEALISGWNGTVTSSDTVFHLGDFARGDASSIFARLKGKKHLVTGNHDRGGKVLDLGWESVRDYEKERIEGIDVVMFHYPILEWDGYFRNGKAAVASIQLFGHVHSTPTVAKHSFNDFQHDVGVDRNGFRPVSFPRLVSIVGERLR